MTDKKLMELAAKACEKDLTNYEWIDTPFYTGFQRRNIDPESGFEEQTQEWNPLDDDADAFRLAINLRMDICISHRSNEVVVLVFFGNKISQFQEARGIGGDARAATRRAIVRAAAAIGDES